MRIIRQVTLDRSNRKKDRSVSITFTTNLEQSTEDFMEIDRLNGAMGVLHFSDRGELTQSEIDEIENIDFEVEGKTKSQRLRNVLYVLWKQEGQKGDFKDFYSAKMEKLIIKIKDRLE